RQRVAGVPTPLASSRETRPTQWLPVVATAAQRRKEEGSKKDFCKRSTESNNFGLKVLSTKLFVYF
nr:hypothetical protein [Nostoc sp. SerVER01]MDZ8076339.1 hypothetical protein [Nostoc sp. DedQUE01]